ncbi:MAG: serine hydrolase [Propioniciclava sp.]
MSSPAVPSGNIPAAPLTRRLLLTGIVGLTAAGMAGCARTPAPPALSADLLSGSVRQQLTTVLDHYRAQTDLLGISLRDRTSGATFEVRGDYGSQSASIAKVMIVLLALQQARRAGTELTFAQYGLASQAIINSDNDSADTLWAEVGGTAAYDRLAADLGLRSTHSDARSDFWSWTGTTPHDQRVLIDLLLDGSEALHTDDRRYLLDLMGRTNAEQTWGVGHDRGSDVTVHMKNGWVQFKSTDNLWAVNSIGHVSAPDRDYTAAIMGRMPTFDEGRQLVDALGAHIFTILGTGQLTD